MVVPDLDYKKITDELITCITSILEQSKKEGVVLGLSGGVDSSVTAALLTRALGPERVVGLIMPEKETNQKDVEDALLIAETLGIPYMVIDITKPVEEILKSFGATYENTDVIAKGNVKARIRMVMLYYYANTHNFLVAATSDRSEYLIGYFTKWGDAAGDFYPIISLYKTQVRRLALRLGIPESIALKPSSPGLWPGQKAIDELGIDYNVIDDILYLLVDKQEPINEVSKKLGISKETVESIWNRIISTSHKRRSPPACPLTG